MDLAKGERRQGLMPFCTGYSLVCKVVCASWVQWLGALLLAGLTYVLPTDGLREAAAGAIVMVLIDTISGGIAALYRKSFQSWRFADFLVKLLGYSMLLVAVTICGRVVLPEGGTFEHTLVTRLALAGIILREFTSVIENLRKMGIKIPQTAVLKRIAKRALDDEAEVLEGNRDPEHPDER